MKKRNRVIAVAGPTASGKSATAVEIAKMLNTDIISADSRQIFKEFNVAVAKPTQQEQQGIKHHLIGIVNPDEEYTVANFADDAKTIMDKLFEQGKTPVVVGGTGLYFRILLENYEMPRVAPNKELRAELHEIEEKKGVDALYAMLLELDPVLAKNMHPNNTIKIIRALEVCKTINKPMSQVQTVSQEPKYDVTWIGLNSEDRQFLYDRIDARVDGMLNNGLEQEARALFEKYGRISSLLSTIGYQEFCDYYDGVCGFEQAVEKIKQNTRRYAKRQLTWFRRNEAMNWLNIQNPNYRGSLSDFVIK